MAEVTIDDPDDYRKQAPVDDRGRVVIGKRFAGKKVNIAIEINDE